MKLKVVSFNLLNPRHGLQWNIPQSYEIINGEKVCNWQQRFSNFKDFIKKEDPDIVLLQETPGFAKNDIANIMKLRVGSVKKGDIANKNTAILLKNGQDYTKVKAIAKNSDKTIIKTTINEKTILIASVHIKGYNLKTKEEKQKLGHADLESILQEMDKIDADIKIIGGDFNEHTNASWPRYSKILSYGYKTKIDYNITELNSKESIDAIFYQGDIKQVSSHSKDIKASDHCAIVYNYIT